MSTLKDKLRELCKEKGVSFRKVESDLGFGAGYLSKLDKSSPKSENLKLLSDYFGISYDALAELIPKRKYVVTIPHISMEAFLGEDEVRRRKEEEEKRREKMRIEAMNDTLRLLHRHLIPVLGRVAAGSPIEAYEDVLDWVEIPDNMASSGEYFALKIQGDSMEPQISSGDNVIVRRQDTAEDGDHVIALINGNDATCKRLKKYKDGIALISNNPAYSPMYFSGTEVESTPVLILGVVVESRHKF